MMHLEAIKARNVNAGDKLGRNNGNPRALRAEHYADKGRRAAIAFHSVGPMDREIFVRDEEPSRPAFVRFVA